MGQGIVVVGAVGDRECGISNALCAIYDGKRLVRRFHDIYGLFHRQN